MYILDASVAVKWFFENELNGHKAKAALQRLVENPDEFIVPDLFYIEVSAVLGRKSGNNEKFCALSIDRIYRLGIKTVPVGQDLLLNSIELACKLGISVYDSIYATTAEIMKGRWLTADEKAARKLPKARYHLLSEFD